MEVWQSCRSVPLPCELCLWFQVDSFRTELNCTTPSWRVRKLDAVEKTLHTGSQKCSVLQIRERNTGVLFFPPKHSASIMSSLSSIWGGWKERLIQFSEKLAKTKFIKKIPTAATNKGKLTATCKTEEPSFEHLRVLKHESTHECHPRNQGRMNRNWGVCMQKRCLFRLPVSWPWCVPEGVIL